MGKSDYFANLAVKTMVQTRMFRYLLCHHQLHRPAKLPPGSNCCLPPHHPAISNHIKQLQTQDPLSPLSLLFSLLLPSDLVLCGREENSR